MKTDTEYMQDLLPDYYKCEPRENGVHCFSEIDKGIDDCDPEQWKFRMLAMERYFEGRLLEVYHQTCTNHREFTVYLKPVFNQ